YRLPDLQITQRWCDETPSDFIFDVKLHRLLSRHSTSPQMLPADMRRRVKVEKDRGKLTPSIEREATPRFTAALEPFKSSHKLGALLLQLSPAFSPRSNKLEDLEDLLDALSGERVAVELRNRGWVSRENLKETIS